MSPEPQTIATLRAGDAVDAVFACTRKERLLTRSGDPYLTVELRDQGGSVKGRVFHDADLLAGRFERGELVRVRARAELFRDEVQLAVAEIARVELSEEEATRFLPVSHRDLDELEGFFEQLSREVYDPGLAALLGRLLADKELRAGLRRAPCSLPESIGRGTRSAAHHAFLGGLLEHTVAVAQMALELCAVHPRLDRDLLLCAALVHDLGKTREYAYGAEITRTEEGRMLGHIELGLRLISSHAPALAAKRRLALEHCVLAHHGVEGLAGRFASAEALALQRLNALDAGVKGAFEQGLGH
ncbi:MAG TPA: HD domain-containing protein [Solirubrobacteraceae bacterium]|jgi:3'-5' exoribonuclease|nr:HD domain-containing protein [Solirubrobacteraceae bacterium]